MPDSSPRPDSINVEQIMEHIRGRIREKRGVDDTDQQLRDLAATKLATFVDTHGNRTNLVERFRDVRTTDDSAPLPNYSFDESTLFETHRGPLRWMRKLLAPVLRLFFDPLPLIEALHTQSRLNALHAEREAAREAARRSMDQLYYELAHNLVAETTRLGLEVKSLRMRVESVATRLEFNERRTRALESTVVWSSVEPADRVAPVAPAPPTSAPEPTPDAAATTESGAPRPKRRRRRRGKRGGGAGTSTDTAGTVGPEADDSGSGDYGDHGDRDHRDHDATDAKASDQAAREAGETHASTAERIEQAMAADVQPAEPQAFHAGPGRTPDDPQ